MGDNIAVIGGGMFGVTAATELANAGFDVTLYEQNEDILKSASGSNHWRLHRGYHYPQSDETAEMTLETEPLFRERYADAVVPQTDHYYAIACDSWVNFDEYIEFLDSYGLEYESVDSRLVDNHRIEEVLLVDENHVSVQKLRSICRSELRNAGVTINLGHKVTSLDLLEHDHFVIATYASMNSLLPKGHDLRRMYKFEVCEIPMVSLPDRYEGSNIIVVYGPFMSVDPWGETDYFLMADYHNMRHHSTTGYTPDLPDEFQNLLNVGLIENPDITNFKSFREHGRKYLPGVADADHVGSFFTIRTILPDVEETDARPTIVEQAGDVITVFGGKLATSVFTAEEVVRTAERSWGNERR